MEIFIEDIPTEGLHLKGELPDTIFGLDPKDSIRPAGPVHYSIDIYSFEDGVSLTGSLGGPFQLQCGTCLEYFDFEANFPNWTSNLDTEEGQISFDPTIEIREDILMGLPSSPRCDDFAEGHVCPKAHLLEETRDESSDDEGEDDDDGRNVWGALDQIS